MSLKNAIAALFVFLVVVAVPTAASAGPIYVFSLSSGVQPTNVGIITLTQVDNQRVNVKVDLIDTALPNPQYGFVNTGNGSKAPFAFNIGADETNVTATFIQPAGGNFPAGGPGGPTEAFSLNLAGGANPGFGSFTVEISSSAQNGSVGAYFGDLEFVLFRQSGLDTSNFIANGDGYFFSADLTDGRAENEGVGGGNTGSQGWRDRTECTTCTQTQVPEPASMLLLGTGLLAVARARRKKTS